MSDFAFTPSDNEFRARLHPQLQRVLDRAMELTTVGFGLSEHAVITASEQWELYQAAQLPPPPPPAARAAAEETPKPRKRRTFKATRDDDDCPDDDDPPPVVSPHSSAEFDFNHVIDGFMIKYNHQIKADGFGWAVDLLPRAADGTFDAGNHAAQLQVALAMSLASQEIGFTLVWGGNWTERLSATTVEGLEAAIAAYSAINPNPIYIYIDHFELEMIR